ncbi:MAG: recombination protein O N-terminal domain-containing protein [Veillonella sp.]|uniref:DNA repair protein RecO n=1 Tax=Veillonella sp. TaxID=1926307 RepID=UPI0025E293CF|nr:DNA repair protein RecO C-terminal domain-containing protein [Veillonella sp.]MBS4912877.1 recombination protein O N-terminal domain-containing protein [Veillonella sp.]
MALGVNYEAIVLWRRKLKTYSVITFLTRQKGIIRCSVPHKRLQGMRSTGYLQPFSAVIITVEQQGEYYNLQQIDGKYIIRSIETDLNSICYAAFAGELISKLFPMEERDPSLFSLVYRFSQLVRTKSVPLAVIILGWQLMSKAGFVPSAADYGRENGLDRFLREFRGSTGFSLSRGAIEGLGQILAYSWSTTEQQAALQLQKPVWLELERSLFAYATMQLGEELSSLTFLHTMNGKAL